jgi:hypothetical protein
MSYTFLKKKSSVLRGEKTFEGFVFEQPAKREGGEEG